MSELIHITAIRDAQSLSLKQIDKTGFQSHPEHLQSERYRHWLELCRQKKYERLQVQMKEFLLSDEAIKTIERIPEGLRNAIEYAEYHGYRGFSVKDLSKQINLTQPAKKKEKKGKETDCQQNIPLFNLITNLGDQLLAQTQIEVPISREFEIQQSFKTSLLLQSINRNGIDKTQIAIDKHYAKPVIINSCIIEIDPCSLLPKKPATQTSIVNSLDVNQVNELTQVNELIQVNEVTQVNVGELVKDDGTQVPPQKEKNCKCKKEESDDCECKCSDKCVEQNPCCAKITPYVAELFVVKDEICKYQPGEISYIENVMESEIRVRKHRHLQREESYTEQEEENNTYEERNLQQEDQFSLNREIDKVVEQSLSINAGATYDQSAEFGLSTGVLTLGASKNFSANLDTSFKRSKKDTYKQVRDESKKVLSKAVSRVEKNIRTLATRKLINETEEKNKHVFGGKDGADKDISRTFHYVNQVKTAQVFSYGKRLMLDFYLPEPSELLKRLVEKQFELKKPEKPCLNIEGIGTSEVDWLDYVQCYGLSELERPPKPLPDMVIEVPINYNKEFLNQNWTEQQPVKIKSGYKAVEFWLREEPVINPVAGHRNVEFTFDGQKLKDFGSWHPDNDVRGPLPVDVRGNSEIDITANNVNKVIGMIMIRLVPIEPVDYLPWQMQVYRLLMEKYEQDLADYNQALVEFERTKENHFNKNPSILSDLMKEQLKHAAISYITCQFFDENDAMKSKVEPCGFPQMDLPESKREGELVRFIEQAFEWKFMNYMLYPYFWGRKCSWEDKFKEESENYLFTKFLRSGYARVSISVRPGFESHVNYYLQTRRIWSGGQPPVMGNAYVPIFQEIKEAKDNFNTDREGYLTWDNMIDPSLSKNEILLMDNLDYFTEDTDSMGNGLGTYSFDEDKAEADLNREITINCITYRIVDIEHNPANDTVKFKLDRDLEIDCCCSGKGKDFDEVYLKKEIPWSTGALYVGAPWKFEVATSLVWLREEAPCLPCYPIECKAD